MGVGSTASAGVTRGAGVAEALVVVVAEVAVALETGTFMEANQEERASGKASIGRDDTVADEIGRWAEVTVVTEVEAAVVENVVVDTDDEWHWRNTGLETVAPISDFKTAGRRAWAVS